MNTAHQSILVTGGAGFIGAHLCRLLLAHGHRVEVLDDLSTGSVKNIEDMMGNPKFSLTVATVLDKQPLAIAVDRADAVFHLAAAVGVRLIVENPVKTIETNISGTENVLAAVRKKNKRILITSTSEVYGKRSHVPFREEDDLVLGASRRPRWGYACSKLMDEFLALAHYRENQLPVTIARLFNTVGPGQSGAYGMVIPRFIEQALNNKPITIYGDGGQTRTFCHVADIVDALYRLLMSDKTAGQVYNIGGVGEVTIKELAELVIQRAGSSSKLEFISFEKAYDDDFEDMQRRVPDLTKVDAAIGYTPKHDLASIIDDVIADYKEKNGLS